VLGAGVPAAVDEAGVADLVQFEAFPVGLFDGTAAGGAAELEDQRFFLKARAAEHDGADFALMALIDAGDGALRAHRLEEQRMGGARHGRVSEPENRKHFSWKRS
jgi:hypothetical protein